ncbi:MAG TPA: CHAT domain-containing protein [Thermoanaerobaculia bacterium]|nr:CHAT domain-containing protein [Thermoanaerobaculia bacterium]
MLFTLPAGSLKRPCGFDSVEEEIQRAHGSAGLRALQRWEEGVNLVVRGRALAAIDVFEAQHAEHRASGERVLATMFDELRRTIRVQLMSDAVSRHDTEAAFRYADGSSLRDVQSALAPDAAILRYATVNYGHQVVFVIRRDSADVVTLYDGAHRRPGDTVGFVSREDSLDVVTLHLPQDGVHQSAAEIARTAATMRVAPDPVTASLLHDLVIAPVLEKLHGITTIAVIPNVELAEISFGALFDAGRGHIVRRGADLRLLLALSRGRDSLSAEEIAALRLDKARVVVLAGCGGAARGDPHAPIQTVADAFLGAGVPTVIATSYDLDDAEAPPTMRLLHTFLRNGDDAAEALRKTTLAELRSRRSAPLSLRFQAVGGAGALIQ